MKIKLFKNILICLQCQREAPRLYRVLKNIPYLFVNNSKALHKSIISLRSFTFWIKYKAGEGVLQLRRGYTENEIQKILSP